MQGIPLSAGQAFLPVMPTRAVDVLIHPSRGIASQEHSGMPHQSIRLSDGFDFIEVEVLEVGTVQGQNEGDLRLRVSVRSDDFQGHYDHVWIAQPDWLSFTDSLRRLEQDRTGHASVQAMSPDEFELNLQIINRAGHLNAHGYLSRRHHRWP